MAEHKKPFNTVDEAVEAIARGEIVVVVDDEDRENEGDLIMAAEHASEAAVAFLVRWTSGVLCVALPPEQIDRLDLPPMTARNEDSMGTAFTVSVDYRHGTTTGISAAERGMTIRALVEPAAKPADFKRPGHVFPLRARAGGVLERPGHTEAAVDLARLAGCRAGGLLAEIVNDDGSMARPPQLIAFGRRHGLPIISIRSLIAWRRRAEQIVERVASTRLPTRHGVFTAHAYVERNSGVEHVALAMGPVGERPAVLVRVHSECLTGESFGSLRCDCQPQLEGALARIAEEGCGVVVYLRKHEGRGIGLAHKLRAYALQDIGRDTVQANEDLGLAVDARDYAVGAQILRDLGVISMRLMTNNPLKYQGIADFGLSIVERVPSTTAETPENASYLHTKATKMGHWLGALPDTPQAPSVSSSSASSAGTSTGLVR